MLAVSHAHDQRAAEPRGDDQVGMIAKHDRQAVRALQLQKRLLHGFDQRSVLRGNHSVRVAGRKCGCATCSRFFCRLFVQATGNQMGDHFAVGRRLELVAFVEQPGFDRAEVFDDAVVHHGDAAVAAQVRMGVDVGSRPVRGPARVADADAAGRRRWHSA